MVRDVAGEPLLRFAATGDIVLHKGELVVGQGVPSPNSNVEEFIIRDSLGTPVALLDGNTGDVHVAGIVTQGAPTPQRAPGTSAFVIRDASQNVQSLIDSDGNLQLRGQVLVNRVPY